MITTRFTYLLGFERPSLLHASLRAPEISDEVRIKKYFQALEDITVISSRASSGGARLELTRVIFLKSVVALLRRLAAHLEATPVHVHAELRASFQNLL